MWTIIIRPMCSPRQRQTAGRVLIINNFTRDHQSTKVTFVINWRTAVQSHMSEDDLEGVIHQSNISCADLRIEAMESKRHLKRSKKKKKLVVSSVCVLQHKSLLHPSHALRYVSKLCRFVKIQIHRHQREHKATTTRCSPPARKLQTLSDHLLNRAGGDGWIEHTLFGVLQWDLFTSSPFYLNRCNQSESGLTVHC